MATDLFAGVIVAGILGFAFLPFVLSLHLPFPVWVVVMVLFSVAGGIGYIVDWLIRKYCGDGGGHGGM